MKMINNKANREEKEREREREPERAIMYYYSTVKNEKSNLVIFTNHIFSAYILHKAKINTMR